MDAATAQDIAECPCKVLALKSITRHKTICFFFARNRPYCIVEVIVSGLSGLGVLHYTSYI